MVLNRADALKVTTDKAQREINESVVPRLDTILAAFDGGVMFVAAEHLGSNQKIRDTVVKMYEQAGWKISFQSDQRDGDCFKFE